MPGSLTGRLTTRSATSDVTSHRSPHCHQPRPGKVAQQDRGGLRARAEARERAGLAEADAVTEAAAGEHEPRPLCADTSNHVLLMARPPNACPSTSRRVLAAHDAVLRAAQRHPFGAAGLVAIERRRSRRAVRRSRVRGSRSAPRTSGFGASNLHALWTSIRGAVVGAADQVRPRGCRPRRPPRRSCGRRSRRGTGRWPGRGRTTGRCAGGAAHRDRRLRRPPRASAGATAGTADSASSRRDRIPRPHGAPGARARRCG